MPLELALAALWPRRGGASLCEQKQYKPKRVPVGSSALLVGASGLSSEHKLRGKGNLVCLLFLGNVILLAV